MNSITDTAMLRHHRVDYRASIGSPRKATRRPVAIWVILALAPLAMVLSALVA